MKIITKTKHKRKKEPQSNKYKTVKKAKENHMQMRLQNKHVKVAILLAVKEISKMMKV